MYGVERASCEYFKFRSEAAARIGLFLDEANRLSRDSLGVLFDLCRTDLQLLIAAPEVARAEGNTTYRLVRHVTDDGAEEVIVSGRRAAPEPEPIDTPTPIVAAMPDDATDSFGELAVESDASLRGGSGSGEGSGELGASPSLPSSSLVR